MKLLTPTLLAATALSVTLPSMAQAQTYQDCESERQGRQVAGAIIGGILGAVIGNELADDSNNNRHGRDRHYGRGGRGGHGSWGRGHRGARYQHRDRGNAEEVGTIAGAGVGALIGAGVAGGEDCANRGRVNQPYYGDKPGAQYSDSGYGNDPYYNDQYQADYDDSAYYDDGYGDTYDYGSSGELLGGADRAEPARVYNAASNYPTNSATGSCHWSQTRRMNEYGQTVTDQVYMCQGTDGIWRPADTYGQ
ncbi:hypothetical protein AWH62_11030 [Maricaulis sp. W15]|uniref:17 kDa surface antigen n=1 Tax=Maricaulis maris TaxID=74318 RepID=A0A495D2L2_9PROT|nr:MULTISPECIES: hypothetical protein [Maricaulis]OLF72356.1 hypothetical protein AWH62_11030 [Maricaulis sp. W15]RKQ95170.1 hypothetical protein C7435_2857 [Maricaulis maris]